MPSQWLPRYNPIYGPIPARLLDIEISPSNPIVQLLGSLPLTVTAHYSDGTTAIVTSQVTWQVANPLIVSVTLLGLTLALVLGSTLVTATLGAVTDAVTVQVTL